MVALGHCGGKWGKCLSRWGEKLFLGEYEHSIDEKGRIAIPARFREHIRDGLVLARGYDRCIVAYPLAQWNEVAVALESLPMTLDKNRRHARSIFTGAYQLEMDRQGRVLLPSALREYAEIGDMAIIAGMNSHLEIWARKHWVVERALMEEQTWRLGETAEVPR